MIEPELLRQLIAFRRERDWEQFHNPKDVAISLSIEGSELLEWFQWKSAEQVQQRLASDKREELEDEIADVAVYLAYLCHDLNIDLNQAIKNKMQKNAAKYPRDKVKGRNDKYDEYS